MKFVIYGAGAIGGIVGARLHATGNDVTLVARGAHFEAIRDRGLTVVIPGAAVTTYEIAAVDRITEAPLDENTAVLLCMKSQDTELALRELAACAPPEIAVVCVQNGVDNERMASRRFAHVYAVCVMCPGVHLEPGVVETNTAPGWGILDLGCYPSGVDERAEQLAALLTEAGFLSEPRADIMAWKYAKLLGNLGNGIAALSGIEAARGDAGKLVREEAEGILRAARIAFTDMETIRTRWSNMTRIPSANRNNSSWQSLQRGTGSIEVDFLNGEIVLIAHLHGLDAPVNALVQRMAHELARGRGEPGSGPVEKIVAALSAVA